MIPMGEEVSDCQLTVAELLPAVAVTVVGAGGGASGVTWLLGTDGSEVPEAFVAVTVKV